MLRMRRRARPAVSIGSQAAAQRVRSRDQFGIASACAIAVFYVCVVCPRPCADVPLNVPRAPSPERGLAITRISIHDNHDSPCAQVAVAWVRLFAVPRPLPAGSPRSTISEGRIMQHVEALANIPGGRGVRGPALPSCELCAACALRALCTAPDQHVSAMSTPQGSPECRAQACQRLLRHEKCRPARARWGRRAMRRRCGTCCARPAR